MPITINTASAIFQSTAPGTSFPFTYNVTGGANTLMTVQVGIDTASVADPVTSITYGGQPLTKLEFSTTVDPSTGTINYYASIWWIALPATGTNTLQVTTSANVDLSLVVTVWGGADTSNTPISSAGLFSGTVAGSVIDKQMNASAIGWSYIVNGVQALSSGGPSIPGSPVLHDVNNIYPTQPLTVSMATGIGNPSLSLNSAYAAYGSITQSYIPLQKWTATNGANYAFVGAYLLPTPPVTIPPSRGGMYPVLYTCDDTALFVAHSQSE